VWHLLLEFPEIFQGRSCRTAKGTNGFVLQTTSIGGEGENLLCELAYVLQRIFAGGGILLFMQDNPINNVTVVRSVPPDSLDLMVSGPGAPCSLRSAADFGFVPVAPPAGVKVSELWRAHGQGHPDCTITSAGNPMGRDCHHCRWCRPFCRLGSCGICRSR
jgi:hypothetical protein